ncbi:hypothetical protein KDD93_08940 [Campylobacter sp. faydin G-24]|uniref:Uncharacterized protein n=1 Tax=Campylobacter anatolicus TaxID=2829105 RepID=A0ABS5HKB8_9BACT|nr:hypothetical protein [Campylobacter anatolicus]MBR8464684.1 hypothetical protein [Campylobacter anatolicus]MBR8465353.1 hypothetical protein [Campylobacter anatolicus]
MQLNSITSSAIGFDLNTSQKSFKDVNGITFAEFASLYKKTKQELK